MKGEVSIPQAVGTIAIVVINAIKALHLLVSIPQAVGTIAMLEQHEIRRCGWYVSIPQAVGTIAMLAHMAQKEKRIRMFQYRKR